MLREDYTKLVSDTIVEGFARGVDLFMESLEKDLEKDIVFSEHGQEAVLEALMDDAFDSETFQE